MLHVLDRNGLLRSEHQRTALVLIGPDVLALLVVALMARLQGIEQVRVLAVAGAGGRHELIGALLISTVLREHDDRPVKAGIFQHVLDGHGVCDTAVQVQMTVKLHNRSHKRQGCAGTNGVKIEQGVFDGQVICRAKHDIGHGRIELHGVGSKRIVIKGVDTVLHVVEEKVVAH